MIGQKTFLSRTASSADSGTIPFVPFALLVPRRHLIPGHPVHGAPLRLCYLRSLLFKTPFKVSQGHSSPFKAIESYSRGFKKSIFLFFRVARWFRIRAMGRVPSHKTSRDPQTVPSLSKAVQAFPRPGEREGSGYQPTTTPFKGF